MLRTGLQCSSKAVRTSKMVSSFLGCKNQQFVCHPMMEPPPDIANCLPARLITVLAARWRCCPTSTVFGLQDTTRRRPPNDLAARYHNVLPCIVDLIAIVIKLKQKCNYRKLFVAARYHTCFSLQNTLFWPPIITLPPDIMFFSFDYWRNYHVVGCPLSLPPDKFILLAFKIQHVFGHPMGFPPDIKFCLLAS
jgi:hypothetical protein